MESEIKYTIWERKISWAQALLTIRKLLKRRGLELTDNSTETSITVNPIKTLSVDSFDETVEALRKLPAFEWFFTSLVFQRPKKKGKPAHPDRTTVTLSIHEKVNISVESRDFDLVEGIHKEISDELHLRNPNLPSTDAPLYLQPTVFVGRHFDQRGDEAFSVLQRFLSLLGLDIKQGSEYESRDIPDKVRERIDSQDIFLALVTGDRNHAWLNAEPAYAKAKGKHIILLVEEGTQYDPTILGRDLEQIRFPVGLIEKSFISLLQEFRTVRVRGL